MTTELKQEAQQSKLCLQAVCRYISDVLAGDASSSEKHIARTIMHLLPLEQAVPIQQAEAKTDEPVGCVDYNQRGNISWLFGPQLPEGTKLYTHPAPGVPDDVVRDAERYRWLADCNNYEAGLELIIDPKLTAHTLGEKIDAAMLAAKKASA